MLLFPQPQSDNPSKIAKFVVGQEFVKIFQMDWYNN